MDLIVDENETEEKILGLLEIYKYKGKAEVETKGLKWSPSSCGLKG